MSALGELQQRFQQAVLHDETLAAELFVAGEAGRFGGGFALYVQAYRARLTAALRDNFPVLHRALGDDAFATLAYAYIDEHPSLFRSIRWFGHALAEFLAGAIERLPHPALIDLARMDWAMRAAFDAAAATPLALSDLASLRPEDWPALRLQPVPSLQVLNLSWGVEPIWKALNDDADATTEEPQALPHALLIWRPALDCRWRSADAGEAAALTALRQAASFAEWCLIIAASGDPEPAMTAAGLLRRWVAEEIVARG